jgi:hypothetical protein
MKMLYRYPQAEFLYAQLVQENGKRDKLQGEFELRDTGVWVHQIDRKYNGVADHMICQGI